MVIGRGPDRTHQKHLASVPMFSLGWGGNAMAEENYSWQRVFDEAIHETDETKLRATVEAAEEVITERMLASDGNGDKITQVEEAALRRAVQQLAEIKVNKLGYPDWRKIPEGR
jgi:hypothetical protein